MSVPTASRLLFAGESRAAHTMPPTTAKKCALTFSKNQKELKLVLIVLLASTWGATIPPAQHAALMTVLDGLACSASVCPRFALLADCPNTSRFKCATNGSGVTELSMQGAGLTGTVASQIGLLSALSVIQLQDNRLRGTLPDAIFTPALVGLSLWLNELTGQFPNTCNQSRGLVHIDTDSSRYAGTIPTCLCALANLDQLWLRSNQISGTVPSCLGYLTRLTVLHLCENQLTGTLPTTLRQLRALTAVGLSFNRFSGPVVDFPSVGLCVVQSDGIGNRDGDRALRGQREHNCFEPGPPCTCCRANTTRCAAPPTTTTTATTASTAPTATAAAATTATLATTSAAPITSAAPTAATSIAVDHTATISPSLPTSTAFTASTPTSSSLLGASPVTTFGAMPDSSVAGAVAGATVGLLMLVAFVVLLLRRRRLRNVAAAASTMSALSAAAVPSAQNEYGDVSDIRGGSAYGVVSALSSNYESVASPLN